MLIHGYLPGCEYVNAHAVEISAPAEEVWAALPDLRSRAKDNRFFSILLKIASLLRRDRVESLTRVGRIEMREGAVLVGGDPPMFKVERVSEPAEVVIGGKHRFATYFLNFFVETAGTKSRLYNVTRAEF